MSNVVTKYVSALIVSAVLASLSVDLYARDRGFNQPGAAGNVGGVAPAHDRGLNQPGRLGGGVGR